MRYIIILFIFPVITFGQISFADVMSIKTMDSFKKVVIENGYEFSTEDVSVNYGYALIKDTINGDKATHWAAYGISDNDFVFAFMIKSNKFFESDYVSESPYFIIVEDIKKKCFYNGIVDHKGNDYVSYSCSQSSYKGKIGFMIEERAGVIRQFPNE
tara:strand:+ start:65 stop:535 length:471 start_codon:yes stop_codon:yes gene_type:complete